MRYNALARVMQQPALAMFQKSVVVRPNLFRSVRSPRSFRPSAYRAGTPSLSRARLRCVWCRKFKSCNSGRELYAPFSGSPSKFFGRHAVCPESSLSPATSMHVSSPEAQEVVGEGECQADTDILGIA